MLTLSTALNTIRQLTNARPLEIHDIYLGSQTTEDSNTLHFCTYYRSISFFGYIDQAVYSYTPLSIKRSSIQKSSHGEIERIMYQVDNVNRGVSAYASEHNMRNKRIVTRLVFRDQLGSYENAKIISDGMIQTISFTQTKNKRTVTLTVIPKLGSLDFETGWPYEIPCNARFADEFCKADKNSSANKLECTVTSGNKSLLIDSTNITQNDNYWRFGSVEMTSGINDGSTRKIIESSKSDNQVILDYALDSTPSVGDTFTLYRGCDKTLDMCENTYHNEANYHGFHTIPLNKQDE